MAILPETTDCRVCAAIRERVGGFLLAAALAVLESLLMIGIILYMVQAVEPVLAGADTGKVTSLVGVGVAGITVVLFVRHARVRLLSNIASWLDTRLAPGLFERSVQGGLRGQDYGLEVPNDLAAVRDFVASRDMVLLYDLVVVPSFVVAAFFIHADIGILAAVSVLCLLLLGLIADALIRMPGYAIDIHAMADRQQIVTAYRNAEMIDASGMMATMTGRWLLRRNAALLLWARIAKRGDTLSFVARWLRMASLAVGIGLLVNLSVEGELAPGAAVASIIFLAGALLPLERAIGGLRRIASFRNAFGRLKAFAMQPDYRFELPPGSAPVGALVLRQLFYRPLLSARTVIAGVSFALPPGSSLGMIGPSGSGKSALARLIVGAVPPTAGNVQIDGVDTFLWNREQFGKNVGYMRQDIELFTGSVAENIARMGEVDINAVIAAAKKADVHDLIVDMEQGYDSLVGPEGAHLSAGQRQRIALARALYGSPRLVVLDEPNSNLDGEGEVALQGALNALKASGATVVVITQRPALLQHLDNVLLLRNGQLEALGPQKEVFAKIVGRAAGDGRSASGGG